MISAIGLYTLYAPVTMPRDKANERGWGNASPQGIHGLCQRHQVAGVYQILDLLLRGVETLNFAYRSSSSRGQKMKPFFGWPVFTLNNRLRNQNLHALTRYDVHTFGHTRSESICFQPTPV